MEEVINTQIYVILTVYNTNNILRNIIIDHLFTSEIHLHCKRRMNLSIFLDGKLLEILMPAQNIFFENKTGWHLIYEGGAYTCLLCNHKCKLAFLRTTKSTL